MAEKKIGTHNGKFHTDEVLGCFMLKQLPEYKNAEIIRSRDPEVLKTCDIVIDVGGVYSHEKKRYDHHQREFSETLESITGIEEKIKLSSAGLVYAHYGKDVIQALSPKPLTKEELTDAYIALYRNIIKEVDAIDNGVDPCTHPLRYVSCTDLCSRIRRLNPNSMFSTSSEEEQFQIALNVVKQDFLSILRELVCIWLPARKYVIDAVNRRDQVDSSLCIIEFTTPGIPWVKHLKQIEEEKKISPKIQFVIFPDGSNGWRVQAVPLDEGFELRSKLLPGCGGLRDEELISKCSVPDAVFVHSTGFIGGAKSREGALKMAQLSLLDDELI